MYENKSYKLPENIFYFCRKQELLPKSFEKFANFTSNIIRIVNCKEICEHLYFRKLQKDLEVQNENSDCIESEEEVVETKKNLLKKPKIQVIEEEENNGNEEKDEAEETVEKEENEEKEESEKNGNKEEKTETEENEVEEENDEDNKINKTQNSTGIDDNSKKIGKKAFFQRIDHSRVDYLKPELKDNTFLVKIITNILKKCFLIRLNTNSDKVTSLVK